MTVDQENVLVTDEGPSEGPPYVPPEPQRGFVAEWAVTMPKVTNEDWRPQAFQAILRSSCALPSETRARAQLVILEAAFSMSSEAVFSQIGESLHEFVRDTTVAESALDLCLGRENGSGQEPEERLLALLTTNCAASPGSGREALLDSFARRLANLAKVPPGADREKLARAVVALPPGALRDRLTGYLRTLYAAPDPAALGSADLAFLGEVVGDWDDWWVAVAPRLRTQSIDTEAVATWVGRAAATAPGAAERCTMAASFWLSTENADELAAAWFAIATSPAPIPPQIRIALGEVLVNA